MARIRSRPARKALIRIVGIGNLPLLASSVAAIRPSVAAGRRVRASALPTKGTRVATDIRAMNMKNRPAKASGWRKKVVMPSFTQTRPVRAGTILSFMSGRYRVSHALAQHPFKVGGVVGFQHGGFPGQVVVPQPGNPETQRAGAQQGGQQVPLRSR